MFLTLNSIRFDKLEFSNACDILNLHQIVSNWITARSLHFLGVPRFIASGIFEKNSVKYRMMVMDRFGEDLQKIFERNNKKFPVKAVFTVGNLVVCIFLVTILLPSVINYLYENYNHLMHNNRKLIEFSELILSIY